jgi:predicted esterase
MQHSIEFTFQARYFTLGNRKSPSQIWFVLHGYGQLASYFIQKFLPLEPHNILVIAPEALSRFYMEGTEKRMTTGDTRVGASWMTREERLADITNYLNFLDEIYRKEVSDLSVPVTVLGFSQGAATATRWVLNGNARFDRLILWAGILPPDIDFTTGREILKEKDILMVYGKSDPFINDSRFAELDDLSEKLGIKPRKMEFDGKHAIDQSTLLSLL